MSTENIEFLSKKVDGKKNEGAKLIEKNPKRRKAIMGCDTTNGRSRCDEGHWRRAHRG